MTDNWIATEIPGVVRRQVPVIGDERGSFTELWRASLTQELDTGMAQANLSRSRAGVLRGMHFHLRQADLWLMVDGEAAAAATDLRPTLHGGTALSRVFELRPGDALFIPPRVAHGFLALSDMALLYFVSREYDGNDEYGFAWDDPAVGIEWPAQPSIVSARDRYNPSLGEVISKLAQAELSAGT